MIWIEVEDVILIHGRIIQATGGIDVALRSISHCSLVNFPIFSFFRVSPQ